MKMYENRLLRKVASSVLHGVAVMALLGGDTKSVEADRETAPNPSQPHSNAAACLVLKELRNSLNIPDGEQVAWFGGDKDKNGTVSIIGDWSGPLPEEVGEYAAAIDAVDGPAHSVEAAQNAAEVLINLAEDFEGTDWGNPEDTEHLSASIGFATKVVGNAASQVDASYWRTGCDEIPLPQ